MDYNWLENVPSSLTPVPVYQPDFGFLQSMQMKANQQYEQGLKEVKTAYSSLFNKQVTGEEATKRQQQYAKRAQDEMKAISATDLSDPKNVLAAENILAPFHEDKLYLKNIAYTSHFENQFQKQNAMKYSKNKEERALYNPIIDSYLNEGVEQLANAPMTEEAYNKLEKRESIPVYDIEADANAEWTEKYGKGEGIKTVDATGNAMIINTNGPKSVAAFRSFYLSIAGRDKYAVQNRVISTAKMELAIKDIKTKNPGINNDQAIKLFGEETVKDLGKYYAGTIADHNKNALELRLKNASLVKGGIDANGFPLDDKAVISQEVAAQIKYNMDKAAEFQALALEAQKQYSKELGYQVTDAIKFSTDANDYLKPTNIESEQYKKAVSDIIQNPRDYIGNVYLSHAADKWAIGNASISSVEVKENPVTKAFNEQANRQWDQQYKIAQLQSLNNQRDATAGFKTIEALRKAGYNITPELLNEYLPEGFDIGGNGSGAFDPNTGFGQTGTGGGAGSSFKGTANPNIGSGMVSVTGTDVIKLPTTNIFHDQQIKSINTVNGTAFNSDGLLQILSKDLLAGGMENTDLVSMSGDLQNAIQNNKYDMSKDAVSRREQFVKILNNNGLKQYTKHGAMSNPNDLRKGLQALITKQSTEHLFESIEPEKILLVSKLAEQNQEMEKEMANYVKRKNEYEEKLGNYLTNDRSGSFDKIKKVKTDPVTGKKIYDVIDTKDVADDFKKFGVYDVTAVDKDGKVISLSNEELANAFLQDEFKFPSYKGADYDFQIGDNYYNLNSIGKLKYNKEHFYNIGGNSAEMMKVLTDAIGFPESNVVTSSLITNTNPKGWGIVGKYGLAKDVKEKINKIGEDVISKMSDYASGASGASGSSITYDMSGSGKDINPIQKATGLALYKEAVLPGNQQVMYTVDNNKKMKGAIPPEMKRALQDHSATESVLGLAESVSYHQFGPNGKPAIEVHFSGSEKGDKDKADIGGQSVAAIKKLGTMWIDISPDAKGKFITELPKAQMTYRYGHLLTDETPVTQNGFEEKAGFKYKIMPDPNSKDATGRFTKAFIFTQHWNVNPDGSIKKKTDGTPDWSNEERVPLNLLVGDRALSPDEIIESKNRWVMAQIQKRRILAENNQNTPPAQGGVIVGDLFKQYR